MTKPSKYQQDIESALDAALLREEKLRKDIFEMNDKCVAMRKGLQAKVERLEEGLEKYKYTNEDIDTAYENGRRDEALTKP